jgi:glucose/arabinose dehydrogenase
MAVALNSRDLTTFLGKILRINPDGSAPPDNPFYDAAQPAAPISYIYNAGVRNTYALTVRQSDGRVFCSENGPSRDRVYSPEAGWDMGYDGSDRSMLTNALWTWSLPIAPVGIDVMQTGAFPELDDRIFIASAGQDYTLGISKAGKRVLALDVDADGNLRAGPDEFLRYEGSARATIIGLAFAADGLYFTTLYNTDPVQGPFTNARLMRVRYDLGDDLFATGSPQ